MLYEQALASGQVSIPTSYPIPSATSATGTPTVAAIFPHLFQPTDTDLATIPQIKKLMDSYGFSYARLPRPQPETIYIQEHPALWLEIDGDLAKMIAGGQSEIHQYTFVKIDGRWYIAGDKIIRLWGG